MVAVGEVLILEDVARKAGQFSRFVATGPLEVHYIDSLIVFEKDNNPTCPAPLICLPRLRVPSYETDEIHKAIREARAELREYGGADGLYFMVACAGQHRVYRNSIGATALHWIVTQEISRGMLYHLQPSAKQVVEQSEALYRDLMAYRQHPNGSASRTSRMRATTQAAVSGSV